MSNFYGGTFFGGGFFGEVSGGENNGGGGGRSRYKKPPRVRPLPLAKLAEQDALTKAAMALAVASYEFEEEIEEEDTLLKVMILKLHDLH